MAEGVFLVQLAISFIVGSFWVLLTTFLADRFGSKIGGFIGGLPSTAAVSFFFIGLTQSTEIAALATTVFPLSYWIYRLISGPVCAFMAQRLYSLVRCLYFCMVFPFSLCRDT